MGEKREIAIEGGAIIKSSVEALIQGPENDELRKAFPDGTKLLSANTVGNVAVVNFSKEYENTNGLDELLLRVTLVNTLTEIEGVEKVRIMVVGQEFIGPSGEAFGDMARIPLDSEGKPKMNDETTVVVYFIDADSEKVVAEERIVEITQGDRIENIIFEEFIKDLRMGIGTCNSRRNKTAFS